MESWEAVTKQMELRYWEVVAQQMEMRYWEVVTQQMEPARVLERGKRQQLVQGPIVVPEVLTERSVGQGGRDSQKGVFALFSASPVGC